VNLRGERDCATYMNEVETCRRLGLDLVDFPMRSRLAPRAERLRALGELFETAPKPLLLHCKTGADRTGFASALYLLDVAGAPVDVAKQQLHLRYGHLSTTRAGILGHILDTYAEARRRSGIGFRAWLDSGYDPDALMAAFGPQRLSRILADRLFDPD
jgi:protein tyrosine/serine phosphatase